MTININEVPTSIPTVAGDDLVAQVEAAKVASETARDQAQAAVASLIQITNVVVLNSASEIHAPPAANTLYLIRA